MKEASNVSLSQPSRSASADWTSLGVSSASICGSMTAHGQPLDSQIGRNLPFRRMINTDTDAANALVRKPSMSAMAAWISSAVSSSSIAGSTRYHGSPLASQIGRSFPLRSRTNASAEVARIFIKKVSTSAMADCISAAVSSSSMTGSIITQGSRFASQYGRNLLFSSMISDEIEAAKARIKKDSMSAMAA